MKYLLIIMGAMLLANCAGMSGVSTSESDKPILLRDFNPNDPYHGG